MDQLQITPQAAFAATGVASAERVTAFLRKVYGWMCVGLAITATVALGVASSPALVQAIFGNKILFFGLFIAELGHPRFKEFDLATLHERVCGARVVAVAAQRDRDRALAVVQHGNRRVADALAGHGIRHVATGAGGAR